MNYSDPKCYTNRELSWLQFNERVLSEAMDSDIPLFERLKFMSITSSNLDEFIMVRAASLNDMVKAGIETPDIAGLTCTEQCELVNRAVHKLVDKQYQTYSTDIIPQLEAAGLRIVVHHEDLDRKDQEYVDRFFEDEVYPVLTPMAVDSSRPFPLVRNKTLNIGALVSKKNSEDGEDLEFATVQVPPGLPRIVQLPFKAGDTKAVILLEEVIERNISKLFLNYDIKCTAPYRVMRSADFNLAEDEAEDLLKEIERSIRMRQWGEAIRLEVEEGVNPKLLEILQKNLLVSDRMIFKIPGALDLTFLMKMYSLKGFEYLKEYEYPSNFAVPQLPFGCDVFEEIRKQDILLFHPYQSFQPVIEFIKQAARDPEVLAIKQTLYRVSGNSPIIAALAQAAENGKQVTVLFELKARFDEENNIIWARRLEQAGCHVIYGLVGLKTHSKITLVVRREEDGIKRYVHLGTGNYNDSTAKLYTDIGLLTKDEGIGEDATAVFNMLSGYSEPLGWNKLSLAPLWLKDRFLYLIHRETEYAEKGANARIIAKMNALCDPDIIKALYEAAEAGVKIDLIIRSICCLKVGVKGTHNNIRVRSIVGNYLEHARIFLFENGGNPELYCASSDWMPRNLERRVEILFPIEDKPLKAHLVNILNLQLKDNRKAHELNSKGEYVRVKDITDSKADGYEEIDSQRIFGQLAQEALTYASSDTSSRVFIPKFAPES